METTGHTITVGQTLAAVVAGEHKILTVERITRHGMLYTNDWRAWWYRHPGHEDGDAVHGAMNRLLLELPSAAPSRELVLAGAAA